MELVDPDRPRVAATGFIDAEETFSVILNQRLQLDIYGALGRVAGH